MRRYDDPVEVRRGLVPGPGGRLEGPEQFLWRGRLWKVSDVVAHWVETGAWWRSPGASAVLEGTDRPAPTGSSGGADRSVEGLPGREVWRVEAARGLSAASAAGGAGMFDLAFDETDGSWALTRCAD